MQAADRGSGLVQGGEGLAIGIVRARFNAALTARLVERCAAELDALGVSASAVVRVEVPGALEMPVALGAMARSRRFDALVAIGCVIRGETYHFELVAGESAAGVGRVSLDHGIAVANAILTVDNEAQAWARADEKGRDAARVAVEMAHLMKALS